MSGDCGSPRPGDHAACRSRELFDQIVEFGFGKRQIGELLDLLQEWFKSNSIVQFSFAQPCEEFSVEIPCSWISPFHLATFASELRCIAAKKNKKSICNDFAAMIRFAVHQKWFHFTQLEKLS